MQNCFELEIVRPTKTELIKIEWVEVQSPNGNFVVGPDHSPIVSVLKYRGKLTYKEVGVEEQVVDIYGGIFSLVDSRATVVLDI